MRGREQLIKLPKVIDPRGNLSFIEAKKHIPFQIACTHWIYNICDNKEINDNSLNSDHEVIIALSGSFDVIVDDNITKKAYTLDFPSEALYIPNIMNRHLVNFSENTLCLIITSEPYNSENYVKNYKTPFLQPNNNQLSSEYKVLSDCSVIEFPTIRNSASHIISVNGEKDIPFDIERIFYIYDIPYGEIRGMHAHKHGHEVLVAASGSFEVELDDGAEKKIVLLDNPMCGLHIPPGIWATQKRYSSNAICLVMASDIYNAEDYINTYSEFKKYRLNGN